MHEIVTLQFGQRANYLATHFWNIQESYFTYTPNTEPSIVDHDIHFRPGIGTDGSDTYTPRTVIYDLKGGFGTLKQVNALYDDTSDRSNAIPSAWSDRGLTTIKQAPIQQTPYQQNLDAGLPTSQLRREQVRYWSDFNRVFFHPRSIVQLNEYSLNSQLAPFESWSAGEELFRDIDREADVLDRDVRLFVEECDSMQGFQIFAGVDDAWGGWTERYVDTLRDEFGKKSVWIYGVEDNRQMQRDKAVARKANAARSLSGLRNLASAYIRMGMAPLGLPEYVRLDGANEWESTALMAAAIESVTLPTRLRSGVERGSRMGGFEQVLNTNDGQNLWELGLSIKQETAAIAVSGRDNGNMAQQAQYAEDDGDQDDSTTFDVNFTPGSSSLLPNTLARADQKTLRRHAFAQIQASRLPKHNANETTQPPSLSHEDLLRRRYNEQAIVEHYTVPLGFPRLDAYPAELFATPEKESISGELSMSAGLTTSSKLRDDVFELRDLVTRYSRVIEVEEREELYDGLTEIGGKYAFGWDSGDNSEDE